MTPFIQESIDEVVRTLVEAVNPRRRRRPGFPAKLEVGDHPAVAVPVAIVGTLRGHGRHRLQPDMLTLFGLVLAVGIVVDDAHRGRRSRWRAHRAGAVARAAPPTRRCSRCPGRWWPWRWFVGGVRCRARSSAASPALFFRQSRRDLAVSTVISAFNSLTLSPALAAILLQRAGPRKMSSAGCWTCAWAGSSTRSTGRSRRGTGAYTGIVGRGLAGQRRGPGGCTAACWFDVVTSAKLPIGYIPNQDQGRYSIACNCPTPPPWSEHRSPSIGSRTRRPRRKTVHTTGIAGQSFTLQLERLQTSANSSSPSTNSKIAGTRRCVATPSLSGCATSLPTRCRSVGGAVHAAAGVGPRVGQRLQDHHRGPQRPRLGRTAKTGGSHHRGRQRGAFPAH